MLANLAKLFFPAYVIGFVGTMLGWGWEGGGGSIFETLECGLTGWDFWLILVGLILSFLESLWILFPLPGLVDDFLLDWLLLYLLYFPIFLW